MFGNNETTTSKQCDNLCLRHWNFCQSAGCSCCTHFVSHLTSFQWRDSLACGLGFRVAGLQWLWIAVYISTLVASQDLRKLQIMQNPCRCWCFTCLGFASVAKPYSSLSRKRLPRGKHEHRERESERERERERERESNNRKCKKTKMNQPSFKSWNPTKPWSKQSN